MEIIDLTKDVYTRNKSLIKFQLLGPVKTKAGIRQGDSISPMLFITIMDEVIKGVKMTEEYKYEMQK